MYVGGRCAPFSALRFAFSVYQPALGRFLQRDTFAGHMLRPQSLHTYTYAENNPATLTDPTGHSARRGGGGRDDCPPGWYRLPGVDGCLPPLEFPPPNEPVQPGARPADDTLDVLFPDGIVPNAGVGALPGQRGRGLTPEEWNRIINTAGAVCLMGLNAAANSRSDTRTREREQQRPTVRVRHYSTRIESIMTTMHIKSTNPMNSYAVWVKYPIITPYNEEAIQAMTEIFYVPLDKRGGFVEFNVDLNKWNMEQDPNLPDVPNAKIIYLLGPDMGTVYINIGFPLTEPGVAPTFFDWKGNPL